MIEKRLDSILGEDYARLKINGQWFVVPTIVANALDGSTAKLYFEAHVTIEPIFERHLDLAKTIAEKHKFKVADLLMKKRENDTLERSSYDTFMTGHGKDLHDVRIRMTNMIQELKLSGFKVWRAKVEDTIMDTRKCDEWELLK